MTTKRFIKKLVSLLPIFVQDELYLNLRKIYAIKLKRAMITAGFPKNLPPDFNEILHLLRSRKLDELPKNTEEFLSVGCAGTWYFNWIESHCGPIKRHVGIEYYSQKPDDLPRNAIWIVNTAGNLKDIKNQSADILFSGQNIEHLWFDDVVNFLIESHRVLKPGGLLAIDSPNRTVTRATKWSHPEHTLEYTANEMVDLLNLSGFEVITNHGLWRCIDDRGNCQEIFSNLNESSDTLRWRISTAKTNPNDSFVWWINSHRSSNKKPDPEALRNRLQQIFIENWTERVRRMLTIVGKPIGRNSFRTENPGVLMYGPYMPLPQGDYTVLLDLKHQTIKIYTFLVAICDVITSNGEVLTQSEIYSNSFDKDGHLTVKLNFILEKMTFGMQFRVISHTKSILVANGDVVLKSHLAQELSTIN